MTAQAYTLPCSAQTPLRSALCFKDYCQHLVQVAPIKCCCFFWVNEGQLTFLNFPKEASTRQTLTVFLFLVDLFHVDLFTSQTST